MGRPRETVKQPKPSRDNQLPGYTGFVQHSKDTFAKTCERHIAFSINSQGDTVGGFATLLQHGAGGGFALVKVPRLLLQQPEADHGGGGVPAHCLADKVLGAGFAQALCLVAGTWAAQT